MVHHSSARYAAQYIAWCLAWGPGPEDQELSDCLPGRAEDLNSSPVYSPLLPSAGARVVYDLLMVTIVMVMMIMLLLLPVERWGPFFFFFFPLSPRFLPPSPSGGSATPLSVLPGSCVVHFCVRTPDEPGRREVGWFACDDGRGKTENGRTETDVDGCLASTRSHPSVLVLGGVIISGDGIRDSRGARRLHGGAWAWLSRPRV